MAVARAVARFARAESARAGGIPGTLGARNAPVPLALQVAPVPQAAGRDPAGRGPRPAAPKARGPAVTVPQAGRPWLAKAGAGRAARRRANAARATPPHTAGVPGGRRARRPPTGRAARAGYQATDHHGRAAYLAVRRHRGPRTAAESAEGVSARAVPRVPTDPRDPTEPRVHTDPRDPTEPRGHVGLRALAGTTPARPATAGPRGRRIAARAASEAEASAVPHRAVGERRPAMKVGRTGPRADAPRRVRPGAPTSAALPRAAPGPGTAVPGFLPAVAAPRLDPDPLPRTSRGSPGCRYPIRSPLTSLIPRRGPS